jgi:hypothetical protein
MASRLDEPPAEVGEWLNECESIVAGEIGRRSR